MCSNVMIKASCILRNFCSAPKLLVSASGENCILRSEPIVQTSRGFWLGTDCTKTSVLLRIILVKRTPFADDSHSLVVMLVVDGPEVEIAMDFATATSSKYCSLKIEHRPQEYDKNNFKVHY